MTANILKGYAMTWLGASERGYKEITMPGRASPFTRDTQLDSPHHIRVNSRDIKDVEALLHLVSKRPLSNVVYVGNLELGDPWASNWTAESYLVGDTFVRVIEPLGMSGDDARALEWIGHKRGDIVDKIIKMELLLPVE